LSRIYDRNYFCPPYKNIILPLVLYGCETSSLTLREEHRLRVFENRVLGIFPLKTDEMIGGWRKMHNKEHHNLHSSSSIIRMIKPRREACGSVVS
jgi:hypothetical protein